MASDHKTLARCSDAHLMDVQIRGLDNMGVSICTNMLIYCSIFRVFN
jgi:hypothetical protein